MEEETDCPHCLADCELTTYSTSITSNKFRWSIYSYMYYCTWKYPGCVTQEIWTWAPSATWPAPLWWNGCQPSTQPTATSTPPTPEGCLDPRDQDTHQPWLRKNYFLLFQRWMISFHNCENQNFLSKGKPQVQRLWQGHCCVQSLLWRLNCVW